MWAALECGLRLMRAVFVWLTVVFLTRFVGTVVRYAFLNYLQWPVAAYLVAGKVAVAVIIFLAVWLIVAVALPLGAGCHIARFSPPDPYDNYAEVRPNAVAKAVQLPFKYPAAHDRAHVRPRRQYCI